MNQRRQFVLTLTDLMSHDDRIVLCLCDIGVFAFSDAKARWPNRVLNLGVSEQGAVGFAAGLALSGYYPVIHTIDSFLLRRAYEFIRLDFGEQDLPGLFVSVGHNADYPALGPSHHCREGRSLAGFIPNLRLCEPSTPEELNTQLRQAVQSRSLSYIRTREAA